MVRAQRNRGTVNHSTPKRIVGLGELVWDIFPDRERLGGAPANVAMHSTAFGNTGILASAVGTDDLGRTAMEIVSKRGVDVHYVQRHEAYPTGTVQVELHDESPVYTIDRDVAWAHLHWNDGWSTLFSSADAVAFGTVLQHTHAGRRVLKHAKSVSRPSCIWLLDLNLRPSFDSSEAIEGALNAANVLKLSEEEADWLQHHLHVDDIVQWCLEEKGMRAVAITRGSKGSRLITPTEDISHDGYPAPLGGDPVGAGDAFTAALIHHLLHGSAVATTIDRANLYASWVASKRGAMPDVPASLRARVVKPCEATASSLEQSG